MIEKNCVAIQHFDGSAKTNTIGVIVHRLGSHFINSVLKGIEEIISPCGYEIIITHSQESMEKEVENAQLLYDWKVDGVIASLSLETKSLSHFTALTEKGIPVVFFDRVENTGNSDVIVIDNLRCGFLATEHLIKQGCNRIAIITSSMSRNVYELRYRGFREALKKFGIPFSRELLIMEDIDQDGGVAAAQQIMQIDPLPDGIFITNDLVATICINVLKEAGIRVPEDIAVVGFNNDPVGKLITPTLTTIDYSGHEVGKMAGRSLLNHLSGEWSWLQGKTAIIPSTLIVRNSSLRGIQPIRGVTQVS